MVPITPLKLRLPSGEALVNGVIGNKEHLIFDQFLTDEECNHIATILKRDEHKILRIPNHEDTGYTGTTSKYSVYNLLNHGDIRPLKLPDRLFNLSLFSHCTELWVQCWGNVLHQGQELSTHMHSSVEQPLNLCATSIYLEGPEPSYTHWEDTGQTQNIQGQLNVVGQHHEHSVKPNIHTQPRISMALDIHWEYSPLMIENNTKRFMHIQRKEKVLYESDYEGMPIIVKETNDTTKLYFGHQSKIVQTIISKKNPLTLWHTYSKQLCEVTKRVKDPKNALVLGLGGGIIPSWLLANTKCKVDAVEIIPELEHIAQKYFHMPKSINVIIDDAFKFVQDTSNTYDIIVVDLWEPTGDFMEKFDDAFYNGLKQILRNPNGCIAINTLFRMDRERHDEYLLRLKKEFTSVTECLNPYPKSNNCVIYCSNNTINNT